MILGQLVQKVFTVSVLYAAVTYGCQTTYDPPPVIGLASVTRQSPEQEEFKIKWTGPEDAELRLSYDIIKQSSGGIDSTQTADFTGASPLTFSFFLDPGFTVSSTLNLDRRGTASMQLYKAGKLCDEWTGTGESPAGRVTCWSDSP
ncbi:MAG: hypothetical protein WBB29_21930 [Geitlerinemataceae cyanobacterium]